MPTITETYLPQVADQYQAARERLLTFLGRYLGAGTYANRPATWADILEEVAVEVHADANGWEPQYPILRDFVTTWGPAMTVAAVAEGMARQQKGLPIGRAEAA